MTLAITVIVCAHNEEQRLPACLQSFLAQTRPPDELLVINNASTDETGAVARQIPDVRVVDEPRKGLVVARETGRHEARGNLLVYIDADCRVPLTWLERIHSWKTLLRCEKSWPAIKRALRSDVDIALTLFRNGAWTVP